MGSFLYESLVSSLHKGIIDKEKNRHQRKCNSNNNCELLWSIAVVECFKPRCGIKMLYKFGCETKLFHYFRSLLFVLLTIEY